MGRVPHWYDMILIMRLRGGKDDVHILHTCLHIYALGVPYDDYTIMMSWWKWLSKKVCKSKLVSFNCMMIYNVCNRMISLVISPVVIAFILIWFSYLYIVELACLWCLSLLVNVLMLPVLFFLSVEHLLEVDIWAQL